MTAATLPVAPRRSIVDGAPHGLTPGEAASRQAVDPRRGLSAAEAAERLRASGPNELEPPRRTSILASIVDAATEPFVVVLAVAGLIAVGLGEVRDGLLILVGLLPIVGADVVTEYRAQRALEELRAAAAPTATVRRDGAAVEIVASAVVPGDIVLLRVGDVVPADLRLTTCDALTIDRSALTGESLPEPASVDPDAPATALADRRSMAFAGTSVVLGRGEGIAWATGQRTELGRIAGALVATDRGRSPLQRELDRLVRIMLVVAIGLIVVTVGLALVRGETLGAALLAGISSAIAAIPEEPPVLLAVVLGLGAFRLLRRGVLVRRLNAQETLGAIDLIVTDKTGTLTENRLTLDAIETPDGPIEDAARRSIILGDALRAEEDAWRARPGTRTGSFTRALLAAAEAATGVRPDLDLDDLLDARPPDDLRPYSWTRARRADRVEELALGAPEVVLALAAADPERPRWQTAVAAAAGAGRRLLLLARREDPDGWRPVAILAFSDPIRAGIPDALRNATEAGIQTVVVTGDHPATALAIARDAGLPSRHVLTGAEIAELDDRALLGHLPTLEVVARATPDQKLRLVRLARSVARTVAVTGDGVNDAPALSQADVGVAMGSGTAVAREAADLVLGDDSFGTLMNGLAEGRRIVANVQKGLVFLASTHVALLGFILIATLAGFAQPLLPIQILWLELFIDLSTSVAFEREPAEPDVMRRPPRPRGVPLLTRSLLLRIAVAGTITAGAGLAILVVLDGPADHDRWVAFTALVISQLVRAYANRSLTHPIHRLPANRFLLGACLAALVIQLGIPFVPPLAEAFRASPLSWFELAVIGLVALVPALVAELIRMRGRVWVA